jgi:hypothetical protein
MDHVPGVWISFSRHPPNWREFLLAMSENNWPHLQKLSVRGEKILARLASGFVFLLAKPNFTRIWRVIIRTPDNSIFAEKAQSRVYTVPKEAK